MPVFLDIQVDPATLKELEERLSAQDLRKAIYQAVDRTTKTGATRINQLVRKRSYVSKKYVDRVIKATRPTGDIPAGKITVSQKLLPLIAFKVSALAKGGVRIRMSKDAGPLTLRHAFLATVKTAGEDGVHDGHRGVFNRTKHLPTKGPNVGKGKIGARGFVGRFAIKEGFGPSVLDIVALPAVFEEAATGIQEVLNKNLDGQFYRFTGERRTLPAEETESE